MQNETTTKPDTAESITPAGFPAEFSSSEGPSSAAVARAAFRWAMENAPGLLRRHVRAVMEPDEFASPEALDARTRFADALGAEARFALKVAADETRGVNDAAARSGTHGCSGHAETFARALRRAGEAYTLARWMAVAVAWERSEIAREEGADGAEVSQ